MKNNLKRFAAALVLLTMLFSLVFCAGCGSFEIKTIEEGTDASTTVADSTGTPAAPTPGIDPEPSAEDNSGQEAPEELTKVSAEETAEQLDTGCFEISELMLKNKAFLRADDGRYYDWIELRNRSSESADTAGYRLTTAKGEWELPSITVEAGGYIVFFAGNSTAEDMIPFSVSPYDVLTLTAPSGAVGDTLECPELKSDCSYARSDDGIFSMTAQPSPGYENGISGFISYQESLRAEGPLVINEVVSANFSEYRIGLGNDYPDWVEIKNISDSSVNMADYCLSDSSGNLGKYSLPAEVLAPGACYIILCTTKTETYQNMPLAYFGISDDYDHVYLSRDGVIIDAVSVRGIPAGGSYGRMQGENGWFYFDEASPRRDNAGGGRYICSAPESDSVEGVFEGDSPILVELSADGAIYYTTDGSLPDESSTPYTGPVEITHTCVFRAVSCDGVGLNSAALTKTYIVNEGHSIPVVSICADSPADLADIYRRGIEYTEVPGNISYFDGEESFSLDCGIRMCGDGTLLTELKKNFAIKFRDAYGQDKLNFDLFGSTLTEFSSLTLRGGSDWNRAIIRDELFQDLALESSANVITQHSKFVILYVNGEYYGIYVLKEKINASFIADTLGVDKESVEIYNPSDLDPASHSTELGNEFNSIVYRPALGRTLNNDEVYSTLCDYIDIDSYIDWFIFEGYSGNVDILYHRNIKYYRVDDPDYDGRMRVILFDLDAGFRETSNYFRNIYFMNYDENKVAQIFRGLLDNADFREAFLTRLAELLNSTLSDSYVLDKLNSLYETIEPELERNFARWDVSSVYFNSEKQTVYSFVADEDLVTNIIERVQELLKLTDEEVAHYFYS